MVLAVGGAYALASWDWCGRWGDGAPSVLRVVHGSGTLLAGAAKAEIHVPYPVTRAGYGGFQPTAQSSDRPLYARAIVVQQGTARIGLLSLDLLIVPEPLRDSIAESAKANGLQDVVVIAAHLHSSLGGYDDRWMSQLAGTGRTRADNQRAIVDAAKEALAAASGKLLPVALEHAQRQLGDAVVSRDDDEPEVDGRVDLWRLLSASGVVAELTLLNAHPTLLPREVAQLSADYVGAYEERREHAHGGVELLVQASIGNASAHPSESAERSWEAFATQLDGLVNAAGWRIAEPRLALTRVRTPVVRPDASRLVPALFRAPGDNFLCVQAPHEAEVTLLQLGQARLAFVPAEPTFAAAQELEKAAGASRVVSLADGYLGYLETPEHVRNRIGESRRQYFGPALLDALSRGLALGRARLDAMMAGAR